MRLNRFPAVVVYFIIAMAASAGLAVLPSGAERNLSGLATGPTNPLMLWYPKPADSWTDGVAIGNGRLGAMVFGQPEKDRLQLNDITVWSGGPAPDADRPEGYRALPEIRRLLRENKFPEAERLMQQNMLQQGDYFPSYQTLGDLNLSFTLPEGSITDYQRWLDVSRALAGIAFKLNGDTYTREVFSSAPAGVIVMKLTTSRKGGLTFDVGLSRQVSATTSVIGSDTLLMKGNTDYAPPPRQGRRGAGANDPAAAPTAPPPVRPGAVSYEVQAKVTAKGGLVGTAGNLLKVTGADEATIVL